MKLKVLVVTLVALLATAGSYWVYREYYAEPKSTAIQATGTIEATQVDLSAKASGIIETFSFREGDKLTKGELVAELSRKDLVAQKERDAMALMKAKAQLADLTSGSREQEKVEASANVEIARANYDKAQTDLTRNETLFNEGVISQEEFDRSKLNEELERNRLQAAEARLSLIESGSRPQLIAAAKAEVERSEAILKATEAMLEDLKIYSPINGVILTKNFEVGEYAQTGAALATIADLNDLWIKVYIPTDDLPVVKLGQPVTFTVSGESTTFEGIVCEIASWGEFTPKTIQTKEERTNIVFGVKIRINNGQGILKPGMPADVVFKPEVAQ